MRAIGATTVRKRGQAGRQNQVGDLTSPPSHRRRSAPLRSRRPRTISPWLRKRRSTQEPAKGASRQLPHLTLEQVVALQDALLANADRLLDAALAVIDLGNTGLARSLAILGVEESGKAIALHERRVLIAYEPEGTPFVDDFLEDLWSSHQEKLKLVHQFLELEEYWFGTAPSDPEANLASLGTIKRWARRHDKLKQRGFYVDVNKVGGVLDPIGVGDQESLTNVINYVHQIGWQLRLGEHIEAQRQADYSRARPPRSEAVIEAMQARISNPEHQLTDDEVAMLRRGHSGRKLNNDAYRYHLPGPDSNPFRNFGKPGHEAETRELLRLAGELDQDIS